MTDSKPPPALVDQLRFTHLPYELGHLELYGPQAVVTSPGRSRSIVWWMLGIALFLVGLFVGGASSTRWTGGMPALPSDVAIGPSAAETSAAPPQPLIAPPAAVQSPEPMTAPLAKAGDEAKASAPSKAKGELLAGTLTIDSHPRGASVFLDEQLVGTTPMLLPTIAPGTHVVRLQLDGYHGWSSTTQVEANRRNRVAGSLEEIGSLP